MARRPPSKIDRSPVKRGCSPSSTPERVLEYALARFRTMGFATAQSNSMIEYLKSTAWTGSDAQLQQRVPGLTRLIVGSGEYQFV